MRYAVLVLFLLVLSIGIVFPNGLSLNSIGPNAFGRGGAFVGLANDYTALYWNPAGLTQSQKNFIGVFATDIIPLGTYKFAPAAIDAKTKVNHYIAPNIMGYYHFDFSKEATFGLGVYIPAGIGTEWDGNDLKNFVGGVNKEWMSFVRVVNFSPAVAYKFTDQISLGLAVNIFYGMFDLKRPAPIAGLGVFQYSESSSGVGYSMTFGALAKVNEQFSVGASVRTRTWVKMSGNATNPGMAAIPLLGAPGESDFDRYVAWPVWVAGGIAYKPINELTLTFDVQYSQWSKSEDVFTAKFKDAKWMTVLGSNGGNKFILHWKDATQIRFGADYALDANWNLRAGYYYDPAPAPDETYNILFPSITYSGITLGAGYKIDNFVFDFGAEYLFGTDREINRLTNPLAMPGTHGMDIPAFSFGAGYEF
jgi:long-chain fatty acid transport protein